MHENNSIGEFVINLDVWKSLTPPQQEAIRSAVKDTFLTFSMQWQRQNADAMDEMVKKHGVVVLRTPPDILTATLKAWDEVAKSSGVRLSSRITGTGASGCRVTPMRRATASRMNWGSCWRAVTAGVAPAAGVRPGVSFTRAGSSVAARTNPAATTAASCQRFGLMTPSRSLVRRKSRR
jgi:hypothetical protein